MKHKNFILCSAIMMMIYLCGTLTYYSQIYMLEKYYDSVIITSFLSGWNYLAQAAGIILFILLSKYRKSLIEQHRFITLCILSSIPVLAVSLATGNGTLRICMVFAANLLIGFDTAFGFLMITKYVDEKFYGRCFALAYALGGIGTWAISRVSASLMSTYYMVLPFAFLSICTTGLIFAVRNSIFVTPSVSVDFRPHIPRAILLLCLVIALMAVLTALGSNDPVLAAGSGQIDPLISRFYYAGGLFLAGILFDCNPVLGGISALSALIYPLMAIMLYEEFPGNMVIIGLTDTFTAFFAVWRAGIFMRLFSAQDTEQAYSAVGLCIARIVEGCMILLLCLIQPGRLTAFMTTGILFVVLLVAFCFFMQAVFPLSVKMAPTGAATILTEKKPVSHEDVLSDRPDWLTEKESVSHEDVLSDRPDCLTEKNWNAVIETVENETPSQAAMLSTTQTPLSKEILHVNFAEHYQLTRREAEITAFLAENKTNGEIAALLHLSESTVRFHVSNILKKTDHKSRNEVAREYLKMAARHDHPVE